MRLLILDFMRRWKLVYVLVALLATLFTAAFLFMENPAFPSFPAAVFLGALLVSFDLNKQTARFVSSLPLSRRQIGQAWWHIGFTVAVAISICIKLALAAIVSLVRPDAGLNGAWLVLATVWDAVYAGGVYFALTLFLPGQPVGAAQQSRVLLAVALWCCGTGGAMFFGSQLPTQWEEFNARSLLILFIGIALTIAGYLRSSQVVTERSSYRLRQSMADRTNRRTRKPSPQGQLTGVPLMAWNSFSGLLVFAAAILLLIGVGIPLFQKRFSSEIFGDLASQTGSGSTYWMIAIYVLFATNYRWIMSVRHLRTLPLTPARLNALVLLPTFMSSLAIWLVPCVIWLGLSRFPPILLIAGTFAAFLGLCALANAILLRSVDKSVFWGICVIIPISVMALNPMLELFQHRIPYLWAIAGTFGALCLGLALWVNQGSLTRSNSAYKPKQFPLGVGWGGSQ
jgi:hypothetical protein